ncbi:MAG: cell division protein FtsA [Patescibacteria group bacterium]
MARRITGIDIGTSQVRVVIAEVNPDSPYPRIVGTGMSESKGMRHGYILSVGEVSRSIRVAVAQAEKTAGSRVKSAYVSVGGIGLEEVRSRGEAVIARADAEVTDLDIEKALQAAHMNASSRFLNRRILHTVPALYSLDGFEVMGRPQGMKGSKISVDVLYITALEQHVDDVISAVEDADVAVIDIMAAPLAASIVTLSNAEKKAGCVLANIGAETVSIAVFDNGIPISVKIFKIGSMDITKDIALGLRISLDEAEQLKLGATSSVSKKRLGDILVARLSDIFELIDNHLKKIGRDGMLPAGIILSGGGAGIGPISEIAESTLRLHSKMAHLSLPGDQKIRDSSWAVAYGLAVWGSSGGEREGRSPRIGNVIGRIVTLFRQFLP